MDIKTESGNGRRHVEAVLHQSLACAKTREEGLRKGLEAAWSEIERCNRELDAAREIILEGSRRANELAAERDTHREGERMALTKLAKAEEHIERLRCRYVVKTCEGCGAPKGFEHAVKCPTGYTGTA